MMRGEMQGTDECMLATIADLTGKPLSEVRSYAVAMTLYPTWADVVKAAESKKDGSIFWGPVRATCQILDASGGLWETIVTASYSTRPNFPSALFFGPNKKRLPLKGRGVILLVNKDRKVSHIAPWENGLVYDPSPTVRGKAYTLEDYKALLATVGFKIKRISVWERS